MVANRPLLARHQVPEVDAAALEAARFADVALAAALDMENERWAKYLAYMPDRLRDDPIPGIRATARAVRAAYGPKDSIRDALPEHVTEPLLKSVDRLLKVIARFEMHAD
ncbi:MAG TPA: hypothetical protein VJ850_03885 [Candidatus Limnocylindrales bacterium]|nr:hypothetical protein [Candidatus Limnocylindrales bacterium]